MLEFVKGMTEDYVKITGNLPRKAATPALPGTTLEKNEGDTSLQPEYRSVGKLLYFMLRFHHYVLLPRARSHSMWKILAWNTRRQWNVFSVFYSILLTAS
jgi:hypothetical protein